MPQPDPPANCCKSYDLSTRQPLPTNCLSGLRPRWAACRKPAFLLVVEASTRGVPGPNQQQITVLRGRQQILHRLASTPFDGTHTIQWIMYVCVWTCGQRNVRCQAVKSSHLAGFLPGFSRDRSVIQGMQLCRGPRPVQGWHCAGHRERHPADNDVQSGSLQRCFRADCGSCFTVKLVDAVRSRGQPIWARRVRGY